MDVDSPGQWGDTKGPNSITETTDEHLEPGKQLSEIGIKGRRPRGRVWRQQDRLPGAEEGPGAPGN